MGAGICRDHVGHETTGVLASDRFGSFVHSKSLGRSLVVIASYSLGLVIVREVSVMKYQIDHTTWTIVCNIVTQ